ncbi:uncharacterized protein LOC143303928 [Bombus vancouverensis nearcticus]|uniref:uncharacterized protein LOC143303928 n=1 Tax=Bombus vancouverensis nearcticus TaxID=2705178 RepID=UPI00402B7263
MDDNDILSEEESDDESEDEDGKKNAREYKRDTRMVYQDRDECCRRACVGSTLSFRDVEDALESFSGNRGENVERWFESFEEVADTCMWSDGQKAVYARKLLKGSAKIFASFECHARTWHELKRGLVKEFSRKVNSRQVHQKLEETKKESDEACLAYMYRMLEIASHVDMEEEAKVEYIVDGIIDDENNKAVLYGATSIKGLRKRLVMYEEQKSRRAKSIVKPAKTQKNGKPSQSVDAMKKRRCFICGSEDHLSVKCPERGEGVRCFKCNRLGHVAANCTARQVKTYVISRPERKKYVKDVSIDGCRFVSLVDTGSDLTFIRADEYVRLGSPPLGNCKLKFDGFGSAGNSTWGVFTRVMTVDGYDFTVTLHVVSNKGLIIYSGSLSTVSSENEIICESKTIVVQLLKPYLGKAHTLYLDNWYTSPALFIFLYKNGTNTCGTFWHGGSFSGSASPEKPPVAKGLNGSHTNTGYDGSKYFLTFIDHYSKGA